MFEDASGVNKAANSQLHAPLFGDALAVFDLLGGLVLVHDGEHHMGDIRGGLLGEVQHGLIGRLTLNGQADGGVGGGVVGDLGGFAAACYMRGIDFYNVPTTLLAAVDSSVGGKTAVNLGGIKNIVGAFHQPSGVLIDTDTLVTLDKRLISAGLAEAVKMAATSDAELFSRIEKYSFVDIMAHIDEIIVDVLKIKRAVVEADVREGGIRKILNFGHTLGHGIEALSDGELYHGECVAIGMMAMCSNEARARLKTVLGKLGLPTAYDGELESALELIKHDKKSTEDGVDAIYVTEIGSFEIKNMSYGEFSALAKAALGK